jgi:D-serine deaminase-like pyridoxal phosphate-dependent protein
MNTEARTVAYGASIGRARQDVPTPALVLDLDATRRNIDQMARRMRGLSARLRPHTKVHKSPELARLQIAAGAIGVATATVWEALAMAEAGIADILVANQVVGAERMAALAAAAARSHLTVAVDDHGNLDQLSAAARAAGCQIGVLVELEVGNGRCGARSQAEALGLAEHAAALSGIVLRGMMGYEGHCMAERDPARRAEMARAAMAYLVATVDLVEKAGHPCEIVSAGGTGTYAVTGDYPRVTEIQAGSYVFLDAGILDQSPEFEPALTVAASVISRHDDTIILDAGLKALGMEGALPRLAREQATTLFVHEEHSGYALAHGSTLAIGDHVEVIPGYGPTTVPLYDAYYVVSNGVVIDRWPVTARTPGQPG